jgi:coatomer protein complex subunit epsilon
VVSYWKHSQTSSLPLTHSSELLNIHNAFHSGQYQNVIDFDTAALSSENQLPARVLKLRAQIALGQTKEVLAAVSSEEDTPDLAATKALAQQTAGSTDTAIQLAQDLAENYPENATVQVLAGTVLQAHGNSEEALALLSKHQGNLEA